MLIPRFSIRWLLGLTTFSAVVSLVLASAVRGRPWALGVMAGVSAALIVTASLLLLPEIKFGRRARRGVALVEEISE